MKKKLLTQALVCSMFFVLMSTIAEAQWTKRRTFDGAGNFVVLGDNIFFTGLPKTVYVSTDDALTWAMIGRDSIGWVRAMAADTSSKRLFAATDGAGVWSTSDNGTTWHRQPNLQAHWMTAIGITGSLIFAGTDQDPSGRGLWSLGAFFSSDGGANWAAITNGLTDTVNSRRIRGFYFYKNEILMRTDSGFFVSVDTGKHWTPSGFPFSIIGGFAVSDSTIFITRQDTVGVYRSNDNGRSWEQLANGIVGYPVTLAASTNKIFAGTDSGVFISTNNGDTWTSANTGLQDTVVKALFIKGSYLFAYAENQNESAFWRRSLSDFNTQNSVNQILPEERSDRIEIYDLLGRCIYQGNKEHVPILLSGAYIERVSGTIQKVIVQ